MGGSRTYLSGAGRGTRLSTTGLTQTLAQQKQHLQQQQQRQRPGGGSGQNNLRPAQQQRQQPNNWGNQPGSYKQPPSRTGPSPGGSANKVELGFYKKQLEAFCTSKNIQHEFKTVQMSNKKFVSTVIVGHSASDGSGGHRFKTYPDEFTSAALAEDAASKAALDALSSFAKGARTATVNGHTAKMSSGSVDHDLSKMLDRVVSLVGDRTNGIWTTRIEVEYKERWKSEVPERWISAVIKDGRVEVDEPIPGRYIMKPGVRVQQQQQAPPEVKAPAAANQLPENARAVPAAAAAAVQPASNGSSAPPAAAAAAPAAATQQPRPPPIAYPKEDCWDVYITNVYSTVHIWLRFLHDEHQTSFDDLVTEMEL